MVTIGTQFTIKRSEIPQYVFDAADVEASSIINSDYASKDALSGRLRTFDDIRKDTLLGKLGEHFIQTVFSYTNDDQKWHDLISPDGIRTEIKTWRKQYLTRANIDREINKLRQRKWLFSTKAIVVVFDVETEIFEIEGVYNI